MIFTCRSCGSKHSHPVIDLGDTPLANALLTEVNENRPEARYPLEVVICEACHLVQVIESPTPEELFSNYLYFSSFSDTIVSSAKALATRLVQDRNLGAKSLVMEAASNDGYLLQHYRDLGVPVYGIEPAANIAEVANAKGIRTHCSFFGLDEARKMAAEGLRADVFHANNVLAHVPDLNGFIAGIATVLKPNGVASIEVPYIRDMIEKTEFDTIYHEHLFYFAVTPIISLLARHKLALVDVEHIPMHGGSLRLFISHQGAAVAPSVEEYLATERALGMDRPDYYSQFAGHVVALRDELLLTLSRLKAEGRSIAAYGASAKSCTLLNFFGIGRETLDFIADRSTAKQGLFTPGSHLHIVAPSVLLERQPDYVLLLTWNFAEEILAQQHEYRENGGKFIVPVPSVRVV